jgi:hypothetical protein
MTWGDRLFQMQTGGGTITTYVLEQGATVVGFLSVQLDEGVRPKTLTILEIAAEKGRGFGGVLMRFADTLARQTDCGTVRLNAIEERVSFYRHCGYRECPGAAKLTLDDEIYQPMERPVLYHHHPDSASA